MITIVVAFCLVQNPYLCRELPILHWGYRSVAECLKGGAVSGAKFEFEHAEWQVKGWRCTAKPDTQVSGDVGRWLSDQEHARKY